MTLLELLVCVCSTARITCKSYDVIQICSFQQTFNLTTYTTNTTTSTTTTSTTTTRKNSTSMLFLISILRISSALRS